MAAWSVPDLPASDDHWPTTRVESTLTPGSHPSLASSIAGSSWLHSSTGKHVYGVELTTSASSTTSLVPSLWQISNPQHLVPQQQSSGSPPYAIGQMLSPTPAGLPHGTSGGGIGPSSTPGLGIAGDLSWGRLSVSPSGAIGSSGLDARFHSPLPGLTHPLWSPPLSAYQVTGGSSGLMDGSSSLPFYHRISPPGLTASQFQYLSCLIPVSTSSSFLSPPLSIISASDGLTSPVLRHQYVGITSSANHRRPATPGVFSSTASASCRRDSSPGSPLDSMTSSLNRQLLDYYAGLVRNASPISPPTLRRPFAAVPSDAVAGPREPLGQSPTSRRQRHLRHQQCRKVGGSRDPEEESPARHPDQSIAVASVGTGNRQLLMSAASCGSRADRAYRSRNVDNDDHYPSHTLNVDDELTSCRTPIKLKSENETIVTDLVGTVPTSRLAADYRTRISSFHDQTVAVNEIPINNNNLLQSTPFQTNKRSYEGYLSTESNNNIGLTSSIGTPDMRAVLSRDTASPEDLLDEDEEIDVCAEDSLSNSPSFTKDIVGQTVSMATEKPLNGRSDDVTSLMSVKTEVVQSKVETGIQVRGELGSTIDFSERHQLVDESRTVTNILCNSSPDISTSGLRGIVTPNPRRSSVYNISHAIDVLASNDADVIRCHDDHRQSDKVPVSGTYRGQVGSELESIRTSPSEVHAEELLENSRDSSSLRRRATDDISAVSMKKSRTGFNNVNSGGVSRRNGENRDGGGSNNYTAGVTAVSPSSQLSDDRTSVRTNDTDQFVTSPDGSLPSKKAMEVFSRASAFHILTQEVQLARSSSQRIASPSVSSVDDGRLKVDADMDKGEQRCHQNDSTSPYDASGERSAVSTVTSGEAGVRGPSTVITSCSTIPVGIALARPRHEEQTITGSTSAVSSTAAAGRFPSAAHHSSSTERRRAEKEHRCGTPSPWQRTLVDNDRKLTVDSRINNPLNVARGDKESARDTSLLTSYYGRRDKYSPVDRGWHGLPSIVRPPELSHLHVMTQPTYPRWTSVTSPGSLWYPPGHPASTPFPPETVHEANFRMLERPEPPSPHLFDHRSSAAGIHGFKMVPDLRTGHCYFLPEFTWPGVYDRQRFCDDPLVNFAGLISPSSTSSDCIERKVKCEQLSPAAPVSSHYDYAERKPNAEQLKLSLAQSPCGKLKTESRDHDHGQLHKPESWSKDRLLSVVDARQVTLDVWNGERTVAFESRGTSPLVDHSKLDSDVRSTPFVKLRTVNNDSTSNEHTSDKTESGSLPETVVSRTSKMLETSSGNYTVGLDFSGDSAIDLSMPSCENSINPSMTFVDECKDAEHSSAIDIPDSSIELTGSESASHLADNEVSLIMKSTAVDMLIDLETAAAERTGGEMKVKVDSTTDVIRSPIVYELERITPVDEKEMSSSSQFIAYQPILCIANSEMFATEQPVVAMGVQQSIVAVGGAMEVSALDILSTLAIEQPAVTTDNHSQPSLLSPTTAASVPQRRFSLLDLPLSDLIESSESSPIGSVVDTAYNAPTLKCFVEDEDDIWNKVKDSAGHQKIPPLTPISVPHRLSTSESGEVKIGDVFSSLKVDGGAENMDAMELDMRMKMADLQVRYREKQRELARLQRRRSVGSNERASSVERKTIRRKSTGGCRSRSRTLLMTSSANGKRCHTTSGNADQARYGHVGGNHVIAVESLSSTLRHGSIATSSKMQFNDVNAAHKGRQATVDSAGVKRHVFMVTDARNDENKRNSNETRRKPVKAGNVVKKSRNKLKFGFYSYKKSQKGMSPGQKNMKNISRKNGKKMLSRKKTTTYNERRRLTEDQHPNSNNVNTLLEETPGFYTDEWYRRRSERIFLHKSADISSQPTQTPVSSSSTGERASVTLSSTRSQTHPIVNKSVLFPAATSCALLTSPKQTIPEAPIKSKNNGSTDAVLGAAYRIKSSAAIEAATLAPTTADRHVTHYEYSSTSSSSSSGDSESDLSDAEDMPLSAYINHSITAVKTSALQQDDIVNGLRVLYLKDGLFFEGTVNELMPPDVYGVAIDGERGNRPNIVSREELLQQSVLIVRPTSSRDLPIGSRVCAYWSQKFSCLHPGTVCKANSDSSTDDDDEDIRVDFDDGDAGKIPLDFIRMLPPNFAVQDKDSNLMTLLTSGRKKRAVSAKQRSGSTDQPASGISNCVKLESHPTSFLEAKHDLQSAREDTAVLKAGPSQCTTEPRAKISKKSNNTRVPNLAATEATVLTVMTPSNSKSELKLTIKRNLSHTTTDSGSVSSRSRSSSDEEEHDEPNNKYNETDKDEVSSYDDSERVSEDEESDSSSKPEVSDSDDDKPIKKHVLSNKKGQRRDRRRHKDVDTDSDQDEESPARHLSVKANKRKTARKSSSNREKKRIKRESSASSQEVGSFLSVWQQWRWVGNSTQRPGIKGRARKLFYKAIQRGSEIIKIGDTVSFISNARHLKYVGRVISLWESWDGSMWVRVKWFYHPEETKGGKRLVEVKRALFQSPHEDENDVQTISHKCEVLPYAEYKRYREQTSSKAITAGHRKPHRMRDVYYLAGSYDPFVKEIISFERDVKVNYE